MTSEKSLFASQKKAGKFRKLSTPETADEYLEAGVQLEEAGEKWRAGDAEKALRFFTKAVEMYETGLRFFPKSFDLAYNKARLQYDVTQQPRLYKQLPTPVTELLKIAAESHIYALGLDQNDADMLFNTAQLYSSLAEAALDNQDDTRNAYAETSNLLYRSIEYFETCFKVQEGQFAQKSLTSFADGNLDSTNTESNAGMETTEEEVWTAIVEPVTTETLLQTCLAQLSNLKILCEIQSSDFVEGLASIEQIYNDKLSEKITLFSQSPEQKKDATLAKAAFLCAYAAARCRLFQTSISAYDAEFRAATTDIESLYGETGDVVIALTIADAHIELNSTIGDRLNQGHEIQTGNINLTEINGIRWKHITRALDLFTLATQAPHVPNLAQVHIKRGDCDLLRIRLGEEPFKYSVSEKNKITLIRNASIYYGAAKKVISQEQASEEAQEIKNKLDLKIGLTSFWKGSNHAVIAQPLGISANEAPLLLEEMEDQGFLSEAKRKAFIDVLVEMAPT